MEKNEAHIKEEKAQENLNDVLNKGEANSIKNAQKKLDDAKMHYKTVSAAKHKLEMDPKNIAAKQKAAELDRKEAEEKATVDAKAELELIGRLEELKNELNTAIYEAQAELEKCTTRVTEKMQVFAGKQEEFDSLTKQNGCQGLKCMENKASKVNKEHDELNAQLSKERKTQDDQLMELEGLQQKKELSKFIKDQISDIQDKRIRRPQSETHTIQIDIPTRATTNDSIYITTEYEVTDSRTRKTKRLSFQELNELYEQSIEEWKTKIPKFYDRKSGRYDPDRIDTLIAASTAKKREFETSITNIEASIKQTENEITNFRKNVDAAKEVERELEEAEHELEKAKEELQSYKNDLLQLRDRLKNVTDKLNKTRSRLVAQTHEGEKNAGGRGKPGQNLAHMEAVLAGGAAADPEMYTQLFPPLIDLVWYEKTPYHALLLKLHSSLVPGPFPGQAIRDGSNFGYLGKDGNVEHGFVYDDTSHGFMHDIEKPERDGVKTQLPTKKTFKKTLPKLLRYVVRSKPGSTRRDDELIPYHSMDVVRHTLPIFPTFMGVIACLDERRKLRGTTGTGVQQALRPWFKYADFHASVKRHATSMTAMQREALSATLMWDPATGLVPDPAAG